MNHVVLMAKGLLIGIANIIPGVSGGTFALVLGIYERLMNAIKSINFQTIKTALSLLTSGFSEEARSNFGVEWKKIDGTFLTILAVGGGVAILASSFLIDYLLKNHPALTLAFFCGLILPSLWLPYQMMDKRGVLQLLWLVPGVAVTAGVAIAFSGGGASESGYLMAFASGAIAISAMILPGVSGSFVLLVMGQYQNMIRAIKTMQTSPDMASALYLGFFGLGCLVGIGTFARILSYFLKKFPSPTLAFLIGLILGSFWILWPFKDYDHGKVADVPKIEVKGDDIDAQIKKKLAGKTDIKVATAPNQLPGDWGEVYPCLITFLLGMVAATGVSALGKTDGTKKGGDEGGDSPGDGSGESETSDTAEASDEKKDVSSEGEVPPVPKRKRNLE